VLDTVGLSLRDPFRKALPCWGDDNSRRFTMKHVLLILFALSFCLPASARFEISTPEQKKADAAWARKISRDFDLTSLREFLSHTIAEQKRFEGVDLKSPAVDDRWYMNRRDRFLTCGSWIFERDAQGDGFLLRYYPGTGDRDVVLVCQRRGKRAFRLIEVKWTPVRLTIASMGTLR